MNNNQENNLTDHIKEQGDHYVEHLAKINEHNDVVALEDIVNDRGVLIARKGSNIDSHSAKNIIQHKLAKPLEKQIQLKNSLNGEALYNDFTQILDKYPDLKQVYVVQKCEHDYKNLLLNHPLHPLIIQKQTVFREEINDWYQKGLLSAWLAWMTARELGQDNSFMEDAMIAGLNHDIGFLHIPSDILSKPEGLNPAEWRSIQCHTIIGQLFLKDISGLNPLIAAAIVDHHERCDGSGYPASKTCDDLSLLSKILGMTDSIQAIRINQLEKNGRNLRDAIPFLQINDNIHSNEVYLAMHSIIKKSDLELTAINPHGDFKKYKTYLHGRLSLLKDIQTSLCDFLSGMIERTSKHNQSGLSTPVIIAINNVLIKMMSSGLNSHDVHKILSWLNDPEQKENNSVLRELNEVELVQDEIFWHIKNVHRISNSYFDQQENRQDEANCRELKQKIDSINAKITGQE